ncbi:MAG TPA: hypothetical protein VG013_40480 [Gemmataceae bacterium]|jgi:hypothetical protein|nr:hypothetical protein [Gemmataceae bacterium]
MSRKAIVLGIGIVLLAGGIGTVLVALLRHESDWYLHCHIPEGPERKEESGKFQGQFASLVARHRHDFNTCFTARCINSYFEEDFVKSGVADRVLPKGISEPRIAIEPDKIRLAFRYGTGPWSTIVSIDMRVWLPKKDKEHNVVALELQSLHAGSLPISAQSLLEQVSEAARQNYIEVTWYRHKGNPVALLRFQRADRSSAAVQLQQLELRDGEIVIIGRSTDSNALQAMLPMFPGAVEFSSNLAD